MTITEKKFNVIDSDLSKFAISPKERFVSEVCRYRNYKSKFVLFIKGLEMANVIKSYKKIHIKPDAITEV